MTSQQRNSQHAATPPALAQRDAKLAWSALEEAMHRDPGQRGPASFRRAGQRLDAGELRAAALHLAEHARGVAILTGFCALLPDRVTAETDGPPGALFLADALRGIGIEVTLIVDRCARPLLEAGRQQIGLPANTVLEFPFDDESGGHVASWIDQFLGRTPLTHVVAVERPGPSHTLQSIAARESATPESVQRFRDRVNPRDYDVCHNMRGQRIDEHTAPTHRLLETIAERKLPITTIGIGDGGNELGLGKFAWQDLVDAIATGPAEAIVCRVAADFALLAGTSNWGAYALALAVTFLRGQPPASRWLNVAGQEELIEALVQEGGAVDGRTLRADPTVDGLPMHLYLEPLAEMRAVIDADIR